MTATVAVSRCAWCRRSLSVDGRGRKWCPDCTPEGTVRRWAEKKLIPAVKTPGRGEYRFPKAEIDDHLSSTSSQPEPKTS